METKQRSAIPPSEKAENPEVMEEVVIEELSIDGICGVY
jgi:mycofactocin precursor